MKLTAILALRALDRVASPYSVYVVNHVRKMDCGLTQYHVRRALTEAEANGWCRRGALKRSYGYIWHITPAGRAALADGGRDDGR
jgi:hypothetical protein